ncbi:MAG: hypothetical protein ACXVCO_02215 [Ktedonobacterales bacterium]
MDGAIYWAFPEPQTLAIADPADLAALVGNARKADYLAAVTQFFSAVDEDWLRTGPYDEVAARILAIRGIGAWSANFILIRELGRVERVPVAKGALNQAIARIYSPLTPAEL